MRWRVEISDVSGDKRLLRDVLEGRSIRLHEQAGELFLIGDPFEALETAGEVHALASRVQSIVTRDREG
jgi:UDP-2,3-diacylglucosamine pyrophosphatase LpxH